MGVQATDVNVDETTIRPCDGGNIKGNALGGVYKRHRLNEGKIPLPCRSDITLG